jgi:hypothetical protein
LSNTILPSASGTCSRVEAMYGARMSITTTSSPAQASLSGEEF